jgi:hypothetical protein
MALSSYSELKASIASWLMRDDLTNVIPDFIALAESRIGRDLRVGDMETTATITLVGGEGDLPSDFLEARSVIGFGDYDTPLDLITPGYAGRSYSGGVGGIPRQYTISGDTLTTYPNGGTGSVTLLYYARPPALNDGQTTNWLLAKAPDVYLYGSLIESAPFMADDQRLPTWKGLYDLAIAGLQKLDERSRYASSRTTVRGITP